MKLAIINRGAPGSGKTTGTETTLRGIDPAAYAVGRSDDFPGLYGEDGSFHPELLGKSHPWCFRRFLDGILDGVSVVVVDNTNTSAVEMAPYLLAAQAYGYTVEIRHYTCGSAEAHHARNTHGVPLETIGRMLESLAQKLPPWWPAEKIIWTGR